MLWYVLLYLLTKSAKSSIYTFFDTEVIYFKQKIFLHYVLNKFLHQYPVSRISLIYCKIHCLRPPYPILFDFRLSSFKSFLKALVIVIHFFSQRINLCFFTENTNDTWLKTNSFIECSYQLHIGKRAPLKFSSKNKCTFLCFLVLFFLKIWLSHITL